MCRVLVGPTVFLLVLLLAQTAAAHLSLIRLGRESANSREANAAFGGAVAAGDFDGDGFEDLATGAPQHNNAVAGTNPTGAVVVNFGSIYGLTHEGAVGLFLWGPDIDQRFGSALAAGDFNNDGRKDLAVGAPGRDDGVTEDVGRVFIHEGTLGGINLGPDFDFGPAVLGLTPITGDEFGAALTVGRFNDDLYDDLAIGIPGRNGGGGMVAVLYGSAGGLTAAGADFFTAVDFGVSDAQGDFGRALAAGHQYGDAQDELAIGAPLATVDGVSQAGRVYMAQGTATGLLALFPIILDATHFGMVPTIGGGFGTALAVGRFYSDNGLLDLAIGEPGFESDTGRAIVTHLNTVADGADQFLAFDRTDAGSVNWPGNRFGAALAAGDSDLDGDDELAVGSPRLDSALTVDSGFVDLFEREGSDILDSSTPLNASILNAELQDQGLFGTALCFGAFDGTGQDNLAVGSPGADYKRWSKMGQLGFSTRPGSGQVHIYAPWRQTLNMDGRSGAAFNCQDDLVFSQRPFDELAIASTTKTMTVLLAAEDIQNGIRNPGDTIVIDPDVDWIVDFVIGSGETLVKGETITLINLMRIALCLSSGEACYAIASLLTDEVDAYPGSLPNPPQNESACDPSFPIVQPTFVARMNLRAGQLGMLDTQFTNPHGSRSGSCFGGQRHHSTAYDMALLGRAAMENEWLAAFLDEGSYNVDREFKANASCGNAMVMSLRSPARLGQRAVGVKRGNSGYASDTGVGSYASEQEGTPPAVTTYFGGRTGGSRELAMTDMLKKADLQCVGPGPSVALPPPGPDPARPLTVLAGIPADQGGLPWSGLVELGHYADPVIDLHVERWISQDESTQAEVCFGLVSEHALSPGETVAFGIAPFDGHEGFRIRNVGAGTHDYRLVISDPPSSQMISLMPNEEFLVPAYSAPGSVSFSLTLQSFSSSDVLDVLVEEIGYCFDLDLGTDPRGDEERFQATLVRDDAGIVEYQLLSWEFRGNDSTAGNELAFSATGDGMATAVGEGDRPAPRTTLRVSQYPNPFNPRTTIEYTLTRPGPIRLVVFDARGRRVRLLDVGASREAGMHRVLWDGTDEGGGSVASGVYFWRLETEEGSASGRMALIR